MNRGVCGVHSWGAPPGEDELICPYCVRDAREPCEPGCPVCKVQPETVTRKSNPVPEWYKDTKPVPGYSCSSCWTPIPDRRYARECCEVGRNADVAAGLPDSETGEGNG